MVIRSAGRPVSAPRCRQALQLMGPSPSPPLSSTSPPARSIIVVVRRPSSIVVGVVFVAAAVVVLMVFAVGPPLSPSMFSKCRRRRCRLGLASDGFRSSSVGCCSGLLFFSDHLLRFWSGGSPLRSQAPRPTPTYIAATGIDAPMAIVVDPLPSPSRFSWWAVRRKSPVISHLSSVAQHQVVWHQSSVHRPAVRPFIANRQSPILSWQSCRPFVGRLSSATAFCHQLPVASRQSSAIGRQPSVVHRPRSVLPRPASVVHPSVVRRPSPAV